MSFRRWRRKIGQHLPVFFIWIACVVLAIGFHRLWVSPRKKTAASLAPSKPDLASLESMFTKDEIEKMKREYKASR